MRATVRQRIGLREPASVRRPSAKPPNQARSPDADRVRATVSTVQTPRWTGTSGAGRWRLASQTLLRAVIR